jgi:hypothetical protein
MKPDISGASPHEPSSGLGTPTDELFDEHAGDEEGDEEEERHQELFKYRILDTDPEACFDDIVYVAHVACNAPISLITFLDSFANRLFFKSRIGYESNQYNLGDDPQKNPCIQCMGSEDEIYEIEDVKNAKRPTIAPESIHFYAGVKLTTMHGHTLGTLCIFDTKPRRLTDEQKRGKATHNIFTFSITQTF